MKQTKITKRVLSFDGLVHGRFAALLLATTLPAGLTASAWAKPPESRVKYNLADSPKKAEGIDDAPSKPAVDIKGPKPIIKPVEDVHDFGSVWVGPQLKHSFTIKNEGDAALDISAVKPSCGCTVAGEYPKRIEPGQSGEFPFAMNSAKLHGSFAKHVTVTSNDPITPNLRLTLKGDVKQYVDMTPSSATFGRITDQDPKTREIMITNNTEKALELELKPEPGDPFEYSLKEIDKGKRYAITVATKPPYKEGTLNAALRVVTNIDDQKELMIRTMATVPPRIEVQPNAIMISERGEAQSDAPIARMIRFTNYGKTPAKLLEATVDDPSITVAVRERKEGEAYTVEVQLPPHYQPPPDGRTITLKLDDKEMPEVKVPIRAMGRQNAQAPATPEPAQPDDIVGKPAPAFALETIDGKALSSDTIKNHVTVLNFFAPNCGYCKKQIPRLEKVREQFENKGVRFVNVSQKMGKDFPKDEVVKIVGDLGFKGELALNHDNTVGGMFNANGFPTMVVIGKDGKVGAINVGNVGDLESRVGGQLDALLAGKPVPAATEANLASAQEPAKPAPAPTPAPAPANQPAAKPATPPAPTPAAAPPAAPQAQRVRADDLVGKPAPPFSLKTIEGKDLSNDSLKNNPATVLNFFANNCGYCKKQIPRLETLRKDFEGKGVRFVNVAETMRQEFTQEQTVETMKSVGWGDEVALDPKNEVGPRFGATGYPTMIVLGKSGNVEAVNVGNIGDLETRVKGQITALVEGKPIPAELAKAPAPAAKPAAPSVLGAPAPAYSLMTVDNKPLSNDTQKDAVTVLNFYAPNCGYCKKQIPRLETIRKDFTGKVRFVNVTETMGKEFPKDEAMGILKELGWADEVTFDPKNEVGQKFGVNGFPTMVVIGKNGKVQAINSGNIEDLETKLKSQLTDLLAGKEIAQAPVPGAPADPAAAPKKRPAEEMVGQASPEFALTTMDGKPLASADFGKHKATVLNFVAPTCGFCKKQVPNVDKVRAEYEAKGVRFVNVAQKMGAKEFTNEEIVKVFKDAGSNLELAKDEGNTVGQKFKATSYPTMVVVDKTGKVAHVNVGAKPDIENILKGQLDALTK